MCVIIVKESGINPLDSSYFERAWAANEDGGGVVWFDGKEIHMEKGFMQKDAFLSKLNEINQKDFAFIAHFRIMSKGIVCPENTHPFELKNLFFAHNGTILIEPSGKKTDSETFGIVCLLDKSIKWIKENSFLIEMAIGNSKMAFMDKKTGKIEILNKNKGIEEEGCWFSNTSAKAYNTNNKKPTFGTENFRKANCYFDKSIGCWKQNHNGIIENVYLLGKNVAIAKKGENIISPNVSIPGNIKMSAQEKIFLLNFIKKEFLPELFNLKTQYNNQFSSYQYHDKLEMEYEISAIYTIIDTIKRFIKDGISIQKQELEQFLSNIYYSQYNKYYIITYFYKDILLEELNKFRSNNTSEVLI